MEKVCFMFGQRNVKDGIVPKLIKAIEDKYSRGIRNFVVGNRGSFDGIAASVVHDMKKVYGDIRLTLLLAYHPAERPVDPYYMKIFDDSYYPLLENVPRRFAILRANQYMIKHCDSIICYASGIGNSRDLLEKAERLGVLITNVG